MNDVRSRVLDDACNVGGFIVVSVASVVAKSEMACPFALGTHSNVGLV
ncbi:MAG: hypothetical protein JNK90_22140 [Planctomycetaceae bacterium]|nr:hypothetical protein [Planctomycetaceae bacterium]